MAKTRTVFSLSLVAAIALVAAVLGVVAGRATGSSDGGGGGGSGGAAGGKKIDVIIKASDSSFWQVMLAGAKQAGGDFGLSVSTFGPHVRDQYRRAGAAGRELDLPGGGRDRDRPQLLQRT